MSAEAATTEAARDAGIDVSLLGELCLSDMASGASLRGESLGRRAQIALARLVIEPGTLVSRDALADAVWGASLPASWRESLRNVIGELRRALVTSDLQRQVTVTTGDGGYAVTLPSGSAVDVGALRAAAEHASRSLRSEDHVAALDVAESALRAASRPLLPGADADWVDGLRDELAQLRMGLQVVAGESALALGDPGRAEQQARRLIEAAPLREESHRLYIRALRAAGNRAQALAAYDACRRILSRELGALPAPATQQLFLDILAEEREQQQPRTPSPHGRPPLAAPLLALARTTPFVGRAPLLRWLTGRLRLVAEGGTFVACVSGEPGLGKTRLAAELALACHRQGMGVLYGRAQDRLSLPYVALVEALERGLPSLDRHELALRLSGRIDALSGLLPSFGVEAAQGADARPLAPEEVRRAIETSLGLLAGDGGALLVLDDMHWAARTELESVAGLLADPDAARLLVLVLHRDPRDGAGLPGLGEHPRIERRELEPLTVAEVAQLQSLSGDDGRDAGDLWRSSGGNPLLLGELLNVPAGTPEWWTSSLDELVGERLRLLGPGAAAALRMAAVAGPEFDPRIIAAAGGLAEPRTREVLEAARRVRLLVEVDGQPQRLAFRHGLIRAALLRELDPDERARLHRQLGVQLESGAGARPRALVDLAYHFAAAAPLGDWRRALRYGAPVARHAYDAGVYEDVIGLATRTLDALREAGDPEPRARLELEVLLGGAQRALGDPQGFQTLSRAFDDARTQHDPARMADAALAVSPVGAVSEGLYLDDGRLTLYEQALAALGDGRPDRRARLLARLAGAYAWRQSQPLSRSAADAAVALARDLDDDESTLATVLAGVRHSMVGSGDLATLQSLESELDRLAEHLADPALGVSVALWRYATAVQSGEGTRLEALLGSAADGARRLAVGNLHHSLAFEHAALALVRGRVADAELLVARAAQIGRERGLDAGVVESVRLTQMMLVRGEQRRLGELYDEAVAVFGAGTGPSWPATIAVIDAARGRLDSVAQRIDVALDAYERDGPTVLCPGSAIAYYTPTVVRLGEPTRAQRVRELILPLTGQGAYIAGFAGPIDYHLGLLERSLGRPAQARRYLTAAAAFCDRLGAPRWHARCRAALDDAGYG